MVTTKRASGLGGLAKMLRADLRSLKRKVKVATVQTAELGRLVAYGKAPVAFGELREGLVAVATKTGAAIGSTAPHSEAVEIGSRPHMPPVEPIAAWVRLRGMEGLDAGPGAIGSPGSVARGIAAQGNGSSTPIDAATKIAWAIAMKIKANGTAPTWFLRSSVPEVERILDSYVKSFLDEAL